MPTVNGVNVDEFASAFGLNAADLYTYNQQNPGITGGYIDPSIFGVGGSSKTIASVINGFGDNGGIAEVRVNTPGTIAVAAANYFRIQQISDIGAVIRSLMAGLETTVPRFASFQFDLEFWSTNDFQIVPFVAVMRNGQVITGTDNSGTNVNDAIEAALGTQDHYKTLGPIKAARKIYDNGTTRFKANLKFNFTKVANKYVIHYQKKEFDSENAAELLVGLCVASIPGASITYDSTIQRSYMLAPNHAVI